jgi:propanol-preferring alcohol dehydrogenase
MRAVVFTDFGTFPSLQEVERPTPGPGEVLLKVAGAGACHSDVAVYRQFGADNPAGLKPGFVLGHENAGWIEEVGPGVSGLEPGSAHLVYGPVGCQHCKPCSLGQDTYCDNAATNPYLAIGLGRNGGMAEYVTAPARNLVALGDADPVAAAPLSDAGLTPYHAIKILTALTGATVIATDMKPDAMARAAASGAVTVPGGPDQVAAIRDLTGGRGVDAAFDFVGNGPTIKVAQACIAVQGRITVVGIDNGAAEWSFFTNPYEATLTNTYWGTIADLYDVVALYRAGQITPDVERFTLDDALEAYRRLEAGELSGRAVVAPHV